MKNTEEKKTKQKNCMQKIKAWCGKNFRWILSIIVVFLWIGIWCYKEPIFCFLSDDLYKERNTIIIWISIIFIFFWVGIWTWKKNTLFSRASILIIIAFTGLFLVFFREDIFNFFFLDFKNGAQDNLTKDSNNFITLLLSSLIFLTLWFFRTYDVREQIGQQDFHDALRMLADDKLVSQEIAVLRLIDISKKNKIYDDTIKLAFIKRMKAPYKEVDEALAKTKISKDKEETQETEAFRLKIILKKIEYRTYAQYIFRWLGKRYTRDELDLIRLDLRNQDFTAKKGEEIHYFKDKNNEPFILHQSKLAGVMFYGEGKINLSKVELRLSYLSGINFTKIDLTGANLREADLTGAGLTRADLTRADLEGAILTEAYLTGADLTRADLRGANLREANLREADFTGADLADIRRAIYKRLASVKSLYKTQGLEIVLRPEELTKLKTEKPELFEPPKEEQNET